MQDTAQDREAIKLAVKDAAIGVAVVANGAVADNGNVRRPIFKLLQPTVRITVVLIRPSSVPSTTMRGPATSTGPYHGPCFPCLSLTKTLLMLLRSRYTDISVPMSYNMQNLQPHFVVHEMSKLVEQASAVVTL